LDEQVQDGGVHGYAGTGEPVDPVASSPDILDALPIAAHDGDAVPAASDHGAIVAGVRAVNGHEDVVGDRGPVGRDRSPITERHDDVVAHVEVAGRDLSGGRDAR